MADIATTARKLAARGVMFTGYEGMDQDGDGVWTGPSGDRWPGSPIRAGNTLSLTQFG